jgi:putative ABC transport system permease protein
MNLFQLVLKQMRQRALGTWLTLLSVVLGVALATAVMLVRRESEQLFGQSDYGYDLVVGPKGSKLQLVLNTVYHVDVSPGNIAYSFYDTLANPRNPQAKIAVPYAVGDTYKGHRIVGTLPKLFGATDDGSALPPERVLEYRPGRRYEFAQGRAFHPLKFEAVIGSDVAKKTGLGMGGKFRPTHGMPAPGQREDVHDEEWEVVGVLKPTHTANDNVLFIPLVSFYAIQEHEEGLKAQQMLEAAATGRSAAPAPVKAPEAKEQGHEGHEEHEEHYTLNPDGTIKLDIPKDAWKVSAVLVKSRGGFQVQQLMYNLNNSPLPVMAVNPASVMREFFNTFLRGSTLLLLAVSALVSIVAAVGILVSIYNSVSARMKEIAILRALGATRTRVLTLICLEAATIGLLGGILGLVAGHLLAGMGSVYFRQALGEGINWFKPDVWEAVYLGGVVVIAVLAGLVPALKAYRTPVATNLVAA